MMQYLIFGVNGMAGHIIAQFLKEKGHTVTGFARRQSPICRTIIGDACNKRDVEDALNTAQYDVAVNCIGILNKGVDADLPRGIYLNSVFPHLLAEQLKDRKTKLIHISSDCVYAGTKGGYTEGDIPDAVSYYGRSKALGEILDGRNLTIRTSIVGPELKANGTGLFHWFMNQKGIVEGYKRVVWTGVTTLQLARNIEEDLKAQRTGLYHLVNNQTISKYDLLNLFNTYCRKTPIEIRENDKVVSDRSLVSTVAGEGFLVPGYGRMVQDMAEWIKEHRELYAQYEGL